MRRWPPILGLHNSLAVTLKYLRRNRVQEEIAEDYGVSQPTISRAISAITPLLVQALLEYVPTADDLDANAQYFVDGTLLPCWSWAGHPELYSGKHKTTGMNVQVACTIYGRLAWISDPVPGRRHDNHCLGQSEVLEPMDPRNWFADKGYIGNGMITPFKKPAGGTSSSRSSRTSRPGESCTPIIGGQSKPSLRLSRRLSVCTSTEWLNNPLSSFTEASWRILLTRVVSLGIRTCIAFRTYARHS